MSKKIYPKKYLKKQRVHRKIKALSLRPRLVVTKSLKHISAQIIDDQKATTLAAATSIGLKLPKKLTKKEIATLVGKEIAQKAKEKKIRKVAFDRGASKYHGRIKALAEGARKKGLIF